MCFWHSAAVEAVVPLLIWQAILTDATDMHWDCSQLSACPSSPAVKLCVNLPTSFMLHFPAALCKSLQHCLCEETEKA